MSALEVRPLLSTDEDLARYVDFYGRNGTPRSVDYARWQFLQPSPGNFWVEVAVDEPEAGAARVVATYGSQPLRFRVDQQVVQGYQAVDAATDEAYRGRGLFGTMANTVADRAAADGAQVVFGFPAGGGSTRGHFGRIGWTSLDPVPFIVRPLRTGFVTSRLFKGLSLPSVTIPVRAPRFERGAELVEIDRFGAEFDELWAMFAARVGVAVERDAAYLNWRIVDKPGEAYRRAAVYENGVLQGFVAWVLRLGKHGGNVGYIVELLHRPGRTDVGRSLLRHAMRTMADEGGDLVLAWNFGHSPNHMAFVSTGFVPFIERLRPIELHFGARTLGGCTSAAVTQREAWYLSYCDSDTV
jgi:hypothetical protein